MAPRLKLVLFILLITCTSMSDPTSKRFKFKDETNPTIPSQSTLPTSDVKNQTVLSRSGMCNLTVDQSVLMTISELTHDSVINIVELQLFVSSENKSRLPPDVKWVWANNVGREIMLILIKNSELNLQAVRTLTVGRIKLAVQIYENPQGCIPSKKNGTSFVAKMLLQKLFRTSNTEYQMCYDTKKKMEYGLLETEYTCCKIIHKGPQRECHVYSSYLIDLIVFYQSSYILTLPYIVFPLLLSKFLETSRKRKYYKITDSPMSLSSIIYFVFFEGYGPVKSFFRRLIFIGLVLYCRLRIVAEGFFNFSGSIFFVFYDPLLVYWAVFFPFSDVFKKNETPLLKMFLSRATKCFSIYTRYLYKYAGYDLVNVFVSGLDYQSIVNVYTILFNFKRWQRNLKTFFNKEELGFAKKCWYYFKAVLFSFLYIVCVSFILSLSILFKMGSYSLIFGLCLIYVRKRNRNCFWYYIKVLHACVLTLSIFISLFFFSLYLPYITLLFFAGLILNAVYFGPYVTSITIVIFYSWTFWQNVETKYSTLKMQIYEVCKESTFGPNDGGCVDEDGDNIYFDGYRPIPDDSVGLLVDENNIGIRWWGGDNVRNINAHFDDGHHISDDSVRRNNAGHNGGDGNDGNDDNHHSNRLKIMTKWKYNHDEPMISRQFYDRIREKILPYNFILFNFFIKVFFVCVFAYFLFTIVKILKTADISGTVEVITTMSMSVVPYIFNVVAAKNSEGEEKAENEVQKIKVEKLVSELTEGTDQVHQIYMEMSDDEI